MRRIDAQHISHIIYLHEYMQQAVAWAACLLRCKPRLRIRTALHVRLAYARE